MAAPIILDRLAMELYFKDTSLVGETLTDAWNDLDGIGVVATKQSDSCESSTVPRVLTDTLRQRDAGMIRKPPLLAGDALPVTDVT